MAVKKDMTKDKRIRREYNRIKRILKKLEPDKLKAADSLIQRAAFMHVTLEDLEEDINEHGTVEPFSQTEGIVYDRERPATRIYNTTIRNYTTVCKQLFDLLPEDEKETATDGLMEFVKGVSKK